MHIHAPQVLYYVNGNDKVVPYAIHFDDGHRHRVVTPDDGKPNLWLLAKIHANSVDLQLYQFIYHLGLGHFCTEPFVVGVHNVFTIHDNKHFMSQMLRPHFKNLLGINHFGSISLVSEVAPLTDQTFSVGTKAGMSVFAEYYNTKYSFANMAPDYDLKQRGFDVNSDEDGFPYYYREDGVKLFNILLEYTSSVLKTQFGDDAKLLADPKMKEYLHFCTDEAKIKGFPEVKSI